MLVTVSWFEDAVEWTIMTWLFLYYRTTRLLMPFEKHLLLSPDMLSASSIHLVLRLDLLVRLCLSISDSEIL